MIQIDLSLVFLIGVSVCGIISLVFMYVFYKLMILNSHIDSLTEHVTTNIVEIVREIDKKVSK